METPGKLRILKTEELKQIRSFSDLFVFLGPNPERKYKEIYEEVVGLAKDLVEKKEKVSWNAHHENFEDGLMKKHPTIPKEFISALIRCIENYNPLVNIPNTHLWDAE